jgi:hypothetical protein
MLLFLKQKHTKVSRSLRPYPINLILDREEHRVERNGRRIDLTTREFDLLQFLMRNAGRPVSRASLMEHVWNMPFDPSTNLVDVYVKYAPIELETLRAKDSNSVVMNRAYRSDISPALRKLQSWTARSSPTSGSLRPARALPRMASISFWLRVLFMVAGLCAAPRKLNFYIYAVINPLSSRHQIGNALEARSLPEVMCMANAKLFKSDGHKRVFKKPQLSIKARVDYESGRG